MWISRQINIFEWLIEFKLYLKSCFGDSCMRVFFFSRKTIVKIIGGMKNCIEWLEVW
jgi:hypothetical protein